MNSDKLTLKLDVGFGLFCEKNQGVVSVGSKQPWLSLDLALCMWKNASVVIREKFKELAKVLHIPLRYSDLLPTVLTPS